MEPVENRLPKPRGGLWTSSLRGGECEWIEWCRESGFYEGVERAFLLEVEDGVRVLTVDTLEDLKEVVAEYGLYGYTGDPLGDGPSVVYPGDLDRLEGWFPAHFVPNFEGVAGDFDGFRVTSRGQRETRFSMPLNLYGWDSESTLWFDWCFESVEEAGPVDW